MGAEKITVLLVRTPACEVEALLAELAKSPGSIEIVETDPFIAHQTICGLKAALAFALHLAAAYALVPGPEVRRAEGGGVNSKQCEGGA